MLEVLTRLILNDDRDETIDLVRTNRAALRSASDAIGISLNTQLDSFSVEWISAASSSTTMPALLAEWRKRKIHLLPGGPFYWDDQRRGENFARIALIRPIVRFRSALEEMMK